MVSLMKNVILLKKASHNKFFLNVLIKLINNKLDGILERIINLYIYRT